MLTKVVMTDNLSLPGFANLLAFVFLNMSSKNYYKPVKNTGLISILALKDKKKINLFVLICSSEMSSHFLLSIIAIFLVFGGSLGPILPWDSRGDASPRIPTQVTQQGASPETCDSAKTINTFTTRALDPEPRVNSESKATRAIHA